MLTEQSAASDAVDFAKSPRWPAHTGFTPNSQFRCPSIRRASSRRIWQAARGPGRLQRKSHARVSALQCKLPPVSARNPKETP